MFHSNNKKRSKK
uniref:Uncharacterized protein n=1 Tax=Anguilla anguilla TaxID=7936 RepID=A0A0E9V9K3_ANGAN